MPSRLLHPPPTELTSFEAFSAAMTAAPLDDLHKTYDSDGENDLEDNYEGEDLDQVEQFSGSAEQANGYTINSSMDIDSDDHDDASEPYEYFDPRFDIDRTNLTPGHAKSRHINPELQAMIDRTEIFLEQMSLKFQPVIEEQPMSTTIILANQATEQVLKPYGKHGSQARLSESAMKFLSAGDTVRRPGRAGLDGSKDGKLRFADPVAAKEDAAKREKLKRKAEEKSSTNDGRGRLRIKIRKRADGTSTIEPVDTTKVPSSEQSSSRKGIDVDVSDKGLDKGPRSAHTTDIDEPMVQVDSLSFRKTSAPLNLVMKDHSHVKEMGDGQSNARGMNLYTQDPESLILRPRLLPRPTVPPIQTLLTPLATSFSKIQMKSPTTPDLSSSHESSIHRQARNYACTLDPMANAALARDAYNPLSMTFTWPASINIGTEKKPCMPTPGMLDAFNNILHLYNAEGRNLLSYYVHKYDGPAELGGSPGGAHTNVEPPHALFRLGISQYLQSKIGKMVDNKEVDELGLNPEARRILGQVWEQHPSTQAWFDDELLEPATYLAKTRSKKIGTSNNPRDVPDAADIMNVDDNDDSDLLDDASEGSWNTRAGRYSYRDGLNPVEKTLLARACNISVETVDAFWNDKREKTRAWGAMKLWCEAQTRKKIAKAKREGRW